LVLSFRPDATCALGFAAGGRRALAVAGTRVGKLGATTARLLSGETTGASAALLTVLVAAMARGRAGSWLTVFEAPLRETK
jgi:hypothetical protein